MQYGLPETTARNVSAFSSVTLPFTIVCLKPWILPENKTTFPRNQQITLRFIFDSWGNVVLFSRQKVHEANKNIVKGRVTLALLRLGERH